MQSNTRGSIAGALLILIVMGLLGAGAYGWYYYSTNRHDITFTVYNTQRIEDPNNKKPRYFVYTDKGVFRNADSPLTLKFNSAEVQNRLESGGRFTCEIVGLRTDYVILLENIISCNEID